MIIVPNKLLKRSEKGKGGSHPYKQSTTGILWLLISIRNQQPMTRLFITNRSVSGDCFQLSTCYLSVQYDLYLESTSLFIFIQISFLFLQVLTLHSFPILILIFHPLFSCSSSLMYCSLLLLFRFSNRGTIKSGLL